MRSLTYGRISIVDYLLEKMCRALKEMPCATARSKVHPRSSVILCVTVVIGLVREIQVASSGLDGGLYPKGTVSGVDD